MHQTFALEGTGRASRRSRGVPLSLRPPGSGNEALFTNQLTEAVSLNAMKSRRERDVYCESLVFSMTKDELKQH